MVTVPVRPAGVVVTSVRVAAVYVLVVVRLSTVDVLVKLVMLRMSAGLLNTAVCALDTVSVGPPGTTMFSDFAIGDCSPNRGSGPRSTLLTVPSGAVSLRVPASKSSSFNAIVPSGAVIVRLRMLPGRLST